MDSSWHHLVISWCHCSSSTLWMVWICTWKLRIWVSFKWYRIKDVILNIIFFNSCAPAWVEPEVRAYAWYILSLGFIIPVSIILLSSTIIVCRVKKVGFFYKAKVLYVRLFSLILKINQIVQLRHFSWQIAEKCIKIPIPLLSFTAFAEAKIYEHEQSFYHVSGTKSDIFGLIDVLCIYGCLGTICNNMLAKTYSRNQTNTGYCSYFDAMCKDKRMYQSNHIHPV